MDAHSLENPGNDNPVSELQAEIRFLQRKLDARLIDEIVGRSDAAVQQRNTVREAAGCEKTIFLSGESGSGTGHIARAIHSAGPRARRPFIKVCCSVLSAEMLDDELFGSARGRFQSRSLTRNCLLNLADGGSLFLDEVEAVPLPIQKKLLNVLQQQPWSIEGSTQFRPLDVRMIAATHADVIDRVRRNLFRQDFFDHLNEFPIRTTPLRFRREDIGPLTEHFLKQVAVEEGRPPRRFSVDALELLESYTWPGNVRELQNVVNRTCAVENSTRLTADMLRPWLRDDAKDAAHVEPGLTLREMERKLIETTFARWGGNRERTAQSLGIGLRTLSGKLREYGYPPRGGPGSNLNPSQSRAA